MLYYFHVIFEKGSVLEKRIKYFMLFIAFTALVVLFAACKQATGTTETPASTTATPGPLVGVVMPSNATRWVNDGALISSTLASLNYRCTVLIGDDTTTTVVSNIQTLKAAGMKALIVAPVDSSDASLLTELASDKAAGIKIIAYDRLIIGTSAVDFYATFNNTYVGEIQGQFLVDKAVAATGSGKPLFLYAGDSGDNNAKIFFQGAWNRLQPKIADGTFVIQNSTNAVGLKNKLALSDTDITSILSQISISAWKTATAAAHATADLTVSGTLKGNVYILAANDSTALGLYDNFKPDTAVTSIVITGQDADRTIVQRIIDGKQSMTVFKNTKILSIETAKIAIALIEGKTPTIDTTTLYNTGVIYVPTRMMPATLITKTNIQSELIDSGYYKASDFTGL